ncbi:hypothetical protein [Streptomyces sp. NPDC096068]|uniref:hypothetical protein n=1 Tax=Streptomyces sp. NPDC096068 TaxID=3155424 RepID=UPI003332F0E6
MRNTKAFKQTVTQTLAELARKGVTFAPSTVEDAIEQQIAAVSEQLRIQVRSAWRYFDAEATADRLAGSQASYEESSRNKSVGQTPMPSVGNPELALILAGVSDSLVQTGGDLCAVIVNVAVNAWMAGHVHGEDGGLCASRPPGADPARESRGVWITMPGAYGDGALGDALDMQDPLDFPPPAGSWVENGPHLVRCGPFGVCTGDRSLVTEPLSS